MVEDHNFDDFVSKAIIANTLQSSKHKKAIVKGFEYVKNNEGKRFVCEICGDGFLWEEGLVSPIHAFCKDCNFKTMINPVRLPVITEKCYKCGKPLGVGSDGHPHCPRCNYECKYCGTKENIQKHLKQLPMNTIEFEKIYSLN